MGFVFPRGLASQHGVLRNRIFVVGNIRNDEAVSRTISKEYPVKEFDLNSEENRGWLLRRSTNATFESLEGRGLKKRNCGAAFLIPDEIDG